MTTYFLIQPDKFDQPMQNAQPQFNRFRRDLLAFGKTETLT